MKISNFGENITRDYITNVSKNGVEGYSFGPAEIIMIVEVITQVIKMWKDCKTPPADAAKSAQSPSIFEKLVLRRTCVKNLGVREFRRTGDKVMESILKEASKLSEKDMAEMYDEEESSDD